MSEPILSPGSRNSVSEQIEILPVNLLEQNRPLIADLKRMAASLGLEFGWHYLLDLTWIISRVTASLGSLEGKRIMDAGAGTGVLQWYLASQGAEVISVDRGSRASLPLRFRSRFQVCGLRPTDLVTAVQVFRDRFTRKGKLAGKLAAQARDVVGFLSPTQAKGRIIIYNQDLSNLPDLADNSLDAIVALSALEHNTPEGLERVVKELVRVLKPGRPLAATLTAGRDADWWHDPSSGWCYTGRTLQRLFCMPPDVPSNYDQYDALFTRLQNCAELRDNLAGFYFRSDKNGMPWGVWKPEYQPVGVLKIK